MTDEAQPVQPPSPATGDAAPAVAPAAEPTPEQIEQAEQAALVEASLQHPFGPAFFMTHLRAFVAETCANPVAGLPAVEIQLADGEVLDLCHIVGVTPQWVALAVNEAEPDKSKPLIRTDIVPYATITRVTLRDARPEATHLGFDRARIPRVMNARPAALTPEALVQAAATAREAAGSAAPTGDRPARATRRTEP
jgi:hypothetical protein